MLVYTAMDIFMVFALAFMLFSYLSYLSTKAGEKRGAHIIMTIATGVLFLAGAGLRLLML